MTKRLRAIGILHKAAIFVGDRIVQTSATNKVDADSIAISEDASNVLVVGTDSGLYVRDPSLHAQSGIGNIITHAGSTPPIGSLLCDGRAVSRIDYEALFLVIGVTWGIGDGATTFNLPNVQSGETLISAPSGFRTTGENLAHNHTSGLRANNAAVYPYGPGGTLGVALSYLPATGSGNEANTSTSGGSKNLAAGVGVLMCIRYE